MASPLVSVILPVYNAELYLEACLESILMQSFSGFEVCMYDDNSTDESMAVAERMAPRLRSANIDVVLLRGSGGRPRGAGYARNEAIAAASGAYLCFQDADDVMLPHRVARQMQLATTQPPSCLIGCPFERIPHGSTCRYRHWANNLSQSQLVTQIFTAYGPTIVMPTWFVSRQWFDVVGSFDEAGLGCPEDLLWFYRHLDCGGLVARVSSEQPLLLYRYVSHSATSSVSEDTIFAVRLERLQRLMLPRWNTFTIWNAGKAGRKLLRRLSECNKSKVVAFCDVDAKKIAKGRYTVESSPLQPRPTIPIIHYSQATPPFLICMKLDLTGGQFERNLASLNLTEGEDYVLFS